jgi:hypothetical protein
MKRAQLLLLLLLCPACKETIEGDRRLSSFEITLFSPVGTPENRCILAGTPTVAVDLTGCPEYVNDAAGNTVIRVSFEARAIDNDGNLYETFNSLASVSMVPGKVESAFQRVRFTNGVTAQGDNRPVVTFRASFDDTYLWIEDNQPPPRSADLPGLGVDCGVNSVSICAGAGLACVNSRPSNGFDPDGLAYCTVSCENSECPQGYYCGEAFTAYDDAAIDVGSRACLRTQPTYASGVGGPIHLVEPSLADMNRSDSLIASPFAGEFIEVKRGNMIVTAIRTDGFYVTDTEEDEFNHLFVFNFNRPDDLFAGDKLVSVAGPISEFNGLTELNFPSWEVDYAAGEQPIPAAIDLHQRIIDVYPHLVERGAPCFLTTTPPENLKLLDCNDAMERLEAARVSINVERLIEIVPGSREESNLERFGQWPVIVDSGRKEITFQLITRDNLPFFDPRALATNYPLGTVSGNLRQVAFDDRDDPIWIVEPRDQADCPQCVN